MIDQIHRERVLLGPVDVVCHPEIQRLCLHPYFNHPKGCPNYRKKKDCPPRAPFFLDVFDKEVLVAAIIFDFEDYLDQKRIKHPDWTERALKNPRHWQGHLRILKVLFLTGEKLFLTQRQWVLMLLKSVKLQV